MKSKDAREIVKGDSIKTLHYGVLKVTFAAKSRRNQGWMRIQGDMKDGTLRELEIRLQEQVELVD
jgi:hypothetical protein